jgi:hypothetical protein
MLDDYVNMMMVVKKKRNIQVLILSNLEAEYISTHKNIRIRNVFGGEKNQGFGLSLK